MPFEDSFSRNLAFDICTGFLALPADRGSNIHCVKLLTTAIDRILVHVYVCFLPLSGSPHSECHRCFYLLLPADGKFLCLLSAPYMCRFPSL